MTHSTETKLKAVFILLVVALLVNVVVLQITTTRVISNGERLNHNYEVLAALDRTSAQFTQSGIAIRAYLLSGDKSDLDRLEFKLIDTQLADLKLLTADDNPIQHSRAAQLADKWPEMRKILEHVIYLRTTQGVKSPAEFLPGTSLAQGVIQVRNLMSALRLEERRLLKIRTETLKISTRNAKLAFLFLAVLAAVCLAYIGILFARYMRDYLRALETLAQERRLSRTLIDNMPDYIYAKDTGSRMTLSNVAHARALGAASPDEVLGKMDSDFLPEEVAMRTFSDEQTVFSSGQPFKHEELIVDRQGHQTWVSTIKLPLRDSAGQIIGLVGLSRNIEEFKQLERSLEEKVQKRTIDLSTANESLERGSTERKLLDDQLRQRNKELLEQNQQVLEANRHKSEFLANMSHELRTPLNCIIGFSELMHDGKIGSVSIEHKEFLQDIMSNSRHLLDLINGVLDLAKVESGKMEFHPEPTDLERLVSEVADALGSVAAKNRMRVQIEVDPLLKNVLTDPSKLKQIVYNYMSNALKFTPPEGSVNVRIWSEGKDQFRLEVKDTGCGIQPEDLKRLFHEFVQLNASTTKKYEGTGLGLALTARIVEAQGGYVGVESVPGQGSVFFAVLPRVSKGRPEPISRHTYKNGAAVPSGTPVVLVIEDEQKEQAWLVKKLSEAGYAVETARNGDEALAKTLIKQFDAMTLDLLLAHESGWDLLKAIRAQGPNSKTPVLVVTVVKEEEAAAGFDVDGFMTKPVKIEKLLLALRQVGAAPTKSKVVLAVDDDP